MSDHTDEPTESVDERLSRELGMDVKAIEQQARFRLEHLRLQRGEPSQLGYLFIERQESKDIVVVFDTPAEADEALGEHPLIDSLCAEDCLDAYTQVSVALDDIADHEVILP